jgi:Flp pilus assembly protein TadD
LSQVTGLPTLFASRRLEQLSKTGVNKAALELWLRAGALADQDRTGEVEAALVEALKADPKFTAAQIQLASLYETAGAHEKARARYEQIVAIEPNHVIALNNLAYSLAVHAGERERALELAERAFRIAKAPAVADTLGWIHHLRGDDRAAAPLIESAAAALPGDTDILVHAAVVRAALGDLARARAAVVAARKLDPKVDDRAEIKALAAKLSP